MHVRCLDYAPGTGLLEVQAALCNFYDMPSMNRRPRQECVSELTLTDKVILTSHDPLQLPHKYRETEPGSRRISSLGFWERS